MPMWVMTKRSTTARMTRHLHNLGLTPSQHGHWAGFGMKDWLKANPTWTERQWYDLVVENLDTIRNGVPEPQFTHVVQRDSPAKAKRAQSGAAAK